MSKRITQIYPLEFRTEAVKLVFEQSFSVAEASARLRMSQGTLAHWVTHGKNAPAKAGTPRSAELLTEVVLPEAQWQGARHGDEEPEEDTYDRCIRNGQYPVR